MSFEKHPAISYTIVKSRSTEPHGALFDVSFKDLTAKEASELFVIMRRLQKYRDGSLITSDRMTKFLDEVPDGFRNEGKANGLAR